MKFPPEFEPRLARIFDPSELPDVLRSFEEPKAVGIRINSLLATPSAGLQELANSNIRVQSVPWSSETFWSVPEQREAITHSPAAEAGRLYVQSLSSQLAALILDPQPGEWILDLAAAPGGKTAHLAALMQNRGQISAVEPIRNRFFRLKANLQRLGIQIARLYQSDGRQVGKKTGPRFDRVLIDAPCSAESRLRIDRAESNPFWSLRKIREAARKQRGLIRSGFDALKPGGQMLYCTCTFAPEENEAIVSGLLEAVADEADLLELPQWLPGGIPGRTEFDGQVFDSRLSRSRRITPTPLYDGFFFALIGKAKVR